MNESVTSTAKETSSLSRAPTFPPGRLGLLTLIGAASGAVPIPFLPGRMVTNVRGALAYDVARQHGLSLSRDARRVLSTADSSDPRRARLIGLATWAAGRLLRRVGPLWVLSPAAAAIETFALGHLLDRYLEEARTHHGIRIETEEALRIRKIIEQSLMQTLSPHVVVPDESRSDNPPGEDQRDDATKLVDWALLSTASAPSYLLRRLDASFDAVVRNLKNTEER